MAKSSEKCTKMQTKSFSFSFRTIKKLLSYFNIKKHKSIECSDFIGWFYWCFVQAASDPTASKSQSDRVEKVAGLHEECGSSRGREHENGFFHGAGRREEGAGRRCFLSTWSLAHMTEISGAETAQPLLPPLSHALCLHEEGEEERKWTHAGGVSWSHLMTSLLLDGDPLKQLMRAAERWARCSNHDEQRNERVQVGCGTIRPCGRSGRACCRLVSASLH